MPTAVSSESCLPNRNASGERSIHEDHGDEDSQENAESRDADRPQPTWIQGIHMTIIAAKAERERERQRERERERETGHGADVKKRSSCPPTAHLPRRTSPRSSFTAHSGQMAATLTLGLVQGSRD